MVLKYSSDSEFFQIFKIGWKQFFKKFKFSKFDEKYFFFNKIFFLRQKCAPYFPLLNDAHMCHVISLRLEDISEKVNQVFEKVEKFNFL